jgi:hypothetical protein
MPRAARVTRAIPTAVLAMAAGATAFVLQRVDPFAAGSALPPCPLRALTGLYCPGCGSTRCLHALLHGEVPMAFAMNPLLVLALPLLALMALNAAGWSPRTGVRLLHALGNARAWLVVLVGYWVLRNLPWMPFAWLAPG